MIEQKSERSGWPVCCFDFCRFADEYGLSGRYKRLNFIIPEIHGGQSDEPFDAGTISEFPGMMKVQRYKP